MPKAARPLFRGQGNESFRTADPRSAAKRGQTVPYNINGAPTGAGVADGSITTLKLADGAVTLVKQANMATASVVYRKTAGAGPPEVQTLATLKADLGLTGINSGDQIAAAQADSVAATVADLVTDFNALLAKLRAAGLLAP